MYVHILINTIYIAFLKNFALNSNCLTGLNNPSENVHIEKLPFFPFLKSPVDIFHTRITVYSIALEFVFLPKEYLVLPELARDKCVVESLAE